MNTSFPGNLQYLRTKRLLTKKGLADQIGITAQAIKYYESGMRVPRKDVARRLADFFGVTEDQLFGLEPIEGREENDAKQSALAARLAMSGVYGASVRNTERLMESFKETPFTAAIAAESLGMTKNPVWLLMKKLISAGIIEKTPEHGYGWYRFRDM